MPTLITIICILAAYGVFSIACDVGRWLKRQRKAQEAFEKSQKIIDEHGKGKRKD